MEREPDWEKALGGFRELFSFEPRVAMQLRDGAVPVRDKWDNWRTKGCWWHVAVLDASRAPFT